MCGPFTKGCHTNPSGGSNEEDGLLATNPKIRDVTVEGSRRHLQKWMRCGTWLNSSETRRFTILIQIQSNVPVMIILELKQQGDTQVVVDRSLTSLSTLGLKPPMPVLRTTVLDTPMFYINLLAYLLRGSTVSHLSGILSNFFPRTIRTRVAVASPIFHTSTHPLNSLRLNLERRQIAQLLS